MSTLYALAATATAQQEIKKSRFIAIAGAVDNDDAAKAFVAAHADPAANHNCWAWRIGQSYRFNDDGEPSGTAGKPILQAIDGQALDRVAVVVTRWFGGVLLGSGGLIRAYGGTAALCLRDADKTPLIDTIPAVVTCVFGDLALLQARLSAQSGVQMQSSAFNDIGAEWSLLVPRSDADAVAQLVTDLTSGRATLRFVK
ncbi:IMPACT family protein [Devosia faecipullorum]|uniref:IMPACT family protein n=1 Tax=Devosia faecipullorum TaxID=2755039 RepID=UPI00187B1A84|nr:YigZ family protein [Devosia faecipullorum]MBE7733937.1 YigZ family protein [Devosia faecipullorum]